MSRILFETQAYNNTDDVKKIMVECGDYHSVDEIDDESAWDYAVELEQQDWYDFLSEAGEITSHVVVTGYFMSWMGPQKGGKVFKNLHSAIQDMIMEDSHAVFSITDDGIFVLSETHHDAPCNGNYYEFRVLTKSGETWYEKHKDEDRMFVCETLAGNSRYSKNITNKNYGW